MSFQVGTRGHLSSLVAVVLGGATFVGARPAVPATAAILATQMRVGETGTLAMRAALRITGNHDPTCPPGTGETVECHAHTGGGLVPGLGFVTTSYSFRVDVGQPDCIRVLGYPATLTVRGKGSIDVVLAPAASCYSPDAVLSAAQAFTIVGGSGLYAGASGSGTLSRALVNLPAAVVGKETFTGTLVVAGLDFETTKPRFSGATPRSVRAPSGARRVRVRYRVTATDAVDGPVRVVCKPRSGRYFHLGRTTVRCSATDSSGNTARARFAITVKRRRA
jgi:HYR domain